MEKKLKVAEIKIRNDDIEYIDISSYTKKSVCSLPITKNITTIVCDNKLYLSGISPCFENTPENEELLFDSTSHEQLLDSTSFNEFENVTPEFLNDFDTTSDLGGLNLQDCGYIYYLDKEDNCFLKFEDDNPIRYSMEYYNDKIYFGIYLSGEVLVYDYQNKIWENISSNLPYSINTHDNNIIFLKKFQDELYLGLKNRKIYKYNINTNTWSLIIRIPKEIVECKTIDDKMLISTTSGIIYVFYNNIWKNYLIELNKKINCLTSFSNKVFYFSIKNRLYEYEDGYFTKKYELEYGEDILSMCGYENSLYIITHSDKDYKYRIYLYDFRNFMLLDDDIDNEYILNVFENYVYSISNNNTVKKYSHIKRITNIEDIYNLLNRNYI